MQLPVELQARIEQFFEKVSPLALQKAREMLTHDYKEGKTSPFGDEAKRLVYLGARMPATFAAVSKVLQNVALKGHLLDLGAGPGTASLAALSLFPDLEKITLIEQSKEAIALGQGLLSFGRAVWLQQNLSGPIPEADFGVLSYVLNELNWPEKVIESCWNAVNTLIIIEPGTPKAFQTIKEVRKKLIELNAHIIAPCPHALACPNDWCHSSVRVERSRLHRLLKEGSLGYEDEKFCYLIASKLPAPTATNRILRHPIKLKGHIKLSLCTNQGALVEKTFSKKDKELYRQARKADWGDFLESFPLDKNL